MLFFFSIIFNDFYGLLKQNTKNIFYDWDAVVSWNRWAVVLFQGRFPEGTWHYPQLLPANWSLAYKIMGAELQFIPRFMCTFFPVFLVLFLFVQGIQKRSYAFLLAALALYCVLKFSGMYGIDNGYADIPVAFMGFVGLLTFLAGLEKENEEEKVFYILIGLVISGGAAVTKQAGIYVFLLYPFLFLMFAFRNKKPMNIYIRFFVFYILVAILVVIPFYLYAEYLIKTGKNSSEVQYLTQGIHRGKNFLERLFSAYNEYAWAICKNQGIYIFFFLFSFFIKEGRLYSLLGLGYWLIWAFFFSYDLRNSALATPFIVLGTTEGFQKLFDCVYEKMSKLSKIQIILNVLYITGIIFVFGIIIFLNFKYPLERLQRKQKDLKMHIGNYDLNKALYTYHQTTGFKGKIMSEYQFIGFLPGLESFYVLYHFEDFEGLEHFKKHLSLSDAYYILYPDWTESSVKLYIEEKIKRNEWILIFSNIAGHSLVQVKK
ncbi:MAG: hypothetical protein WHS77_00320 [Brevinematales bacterium]